jgi:4'-phosphopantetheinyl transferase
LDKTRIEIRWLSFEAGAPLDPCLLGALDTEERMQAGQFHFAEDRSTYIVAHVLKRATLQSVYPLPAADWLFERSPHGKPFISQNQAASRLSFNLSHTRGFVAVAVAHGIMVGIDVERIQIGKLDQELADRLFASTEADATRALPQPAQTDALYAYWTLKEAFIKAVGLGLSLPLDAFAFTLEPLSICFDESIREDANKWRFYSSQPTPHIRMGLAAKYEDPNKVKLNLNIQKVTIEDLARAVRPRAV